MPRPALRGIIDSASLASPIQTRTSSVRWTLASLSLPMLLSSLGTSVTNVALPTLADAFGASFSAVQWVVLAYLLGVTTMIVSVGRLGDMVGRRKLLLAGVVLFTLASIACAFAPSLAVLIASRAVQGIAGAIMMALSLALVGEAVPTASTGSAMGLLGSMSAIGTALGPSLGGLLISQLGWRAVFLLNIPLGLLAFLLAHRFTPADARATVPDRQYDKAGSLLLAISLTAYALGMTLRHDASGWSRIALLAGAGLGVVQFWHTETRATHPLVPVASLRDALLRNGLVASALVSTVMMTTLVVGPFYLSRALGLSPARVGLAMSVGPIITALCGVPAGRMVDRMGAARMTVWGLVAIATGALLLSTCPSAWGVAGYVLPLGIATAGYAAFQTANNVGVMSNALEGQKGVIAGLLSLARNLGLITGASAMGALFAVASRTADISRAEPAAVITGMRTTFAVATVLIIGTIALGEMAQRFARPRTRATLAARAGSVVRDSI